MSWPFQALAFAAREIALLASVGLVVGGTDDLAIDLLWLARTLWRRVTVYRRHRRVTAASLPAPDQPGRIAIFVPAWDESAVIGAMLRAAVARLDHPDYRIFVGTYANDPATRAEVRAVADPRVRLVGGDVEGPTTKAECLNRCWAALRRDEDRTGVAYKAVLLHDAEDLVHPLELGVIDRMIERFGLVQLPVLPLIQRERLLGHVISGHYADEFAELHGRQIRLREALGAAIPTAGVGCALRRDVLIRIAEQSGGGPFDGSSLTEDYEIGLRAHRLGLRGALVAMPAAPGEPLVAVRAYFPDTLGAAVRQKRRWLIGIACAGWDRLRWQGGLIERWMRLRDRKAILAGLVVALGYLAMALCLLCWGLRLNLAWPDWARPLMAVTTALVVWRLGWRGAAVWWFYGWREGLASMPRLLVSNVVLIAAAARAIVGYVPDAVPRWDKTAHRFPDEAVCD